MIDLYFDCKNGISGDMVKKALIGLGADIKGFKLYWEGEDLVEASSVESHRHYHRHGSHSHSHVHTHTGPDAHDHDNSNEDHDEGHDHDHDDHNHGHEGHHQDAGHSHGRSFLEVKEIIENQRLSRAVKQRATGIYTIIAKAEAKVHEETLETVHFHEVGRDEAIENILSISLAIEELAVDKVYCSKIHDGKGFIDCSHGRIPVPVPAVMAMREESTLEFVQDTVETEMVTPSGLGILMGLEAEYLPEPDLEKALKIAVGQGSRDTGREGLKAYILPKA